MTLIVLVVVALLLAGTIWLLRSYARAFLRPGKRKATKTPATLGWDGEAFAIPTERGAVRGWFVRVAREPRLTVVVVHGWQSHAGDMLGFIRPILDSGCHAIVYDTLGHGDSDASEFTSMRHFITDLRTVLGYALSLPDASPGIALMGHSMGGAAAMLATAENSAVRGVISVAGPTDPFEITREWLDARGLPGQLLIRIMVPFWKEIIPGPYEELKPIRRIAEIRVPILIIHGSDDKQVPVAHAQRLAAANPAARVEVIEGADHFSVPKHERYAELVREFLAVLRLGRTAEQHE